MALYAAITLYQLGQALQSEQTEHLNSAAQKLFDETCGSIPISVLIWILLHRPPPPPPPWLQRIVLLAELAQFQVQAISKAAITQLGESLKTIG